MRMPALGQRMGVPLLRKDFLIGEAVCSNAAEVSTTVVQECTSKDITQMERIGSRGKEALAGRGVQGQGELPEANLSALLAL